jgi:hypothetical protein
MAAKVALAALISLGLAIVGIATLDVAGSSSAASSAVSSECSAGGDDAGRCDGAERRGHLAWNAASWLIGLALVVAIGRRKAAPADGQVS